MEGISDNNVMVFAPKIILTPTDSTDITRIDFENNNLDNLFQQHFRSNQLPRAARN